MRFLKKGYLSERVVLSKIPTFGVFAARLLNYNLEHLLNITVYGSDLIALLGRNGIGKTRLIKLISQGNILCGSLVDICNYDINIVSSFENKILNLLNMLVLVRSQVRHLVPTKFCFLYSVLGLWEEKSNAFIRMSSGQLKKLWLVIPITAIGTFITLDEPFVNTDRWSRVLFYNFLKFKGYRGSSLLLVTHNSEISDILHYRVIVSK